MSKGLGALENIKKVKTIIPYRYVQDEYSNEINTIEKELKVLEFIKKKLIVGCDESENDEPCLILGVKDYIFYSTFDKKKIDLLKEVLL